MMKIQSMLVSAVLCVAAGSAFAAGDFAPSFNVKEMREEVALARKPMPPTSPILVSYDHRTGQSFNPGEPSFSPDVEVDGYERKSDLPNCGGSVKLHLDGVVYLTFKDVVECSNFDILSNNGEPLRYPNQKLGGFDRAREGAFAIPSEFMAYGRNGVWVAIQSNSKKTRDIVLVRFTER